MCGGSGGVPVGGVLKERAAARGRGSYVSGRDGPESSDTELCVDSGANRRRSIPWFATVGEPLRGTLDVDQLMDDERLGREAAGVSTVLTGDCTDPA